jgi:hypothetical protein
MIATAKTIAGLLLMMQAAPPTALKSGDTIKPPRWISRPTGDDMLRNYPSAALKEGRPGAAAMRCAFAGDGRLRNCLVLAEQPAGYGFGEATLRLASRFQVAMRTTSGHPREGEEFTVAIHFRLEDQNHDAGYRLMLGPGEAASLVTVIGAEEPRKAVITPCPSATLPERRCQLHAFDWSAMPPPGIAKNLLTTSDQQVGEALMECRVVANGSLESCKVSGASSHNEALLLELAKQFRAPKKASDGTVIPGGRVVMRFDWKLIAAESGPLPGEPIKSPPSMAEH